MAQENSHSDKQIRKQARQAERAARKQARKERREQRRAERQMRRNQRRLRQQAFAEKIAEKITWLFDNEIRQIQQEKKTSISTKRHSVNITLLSSEIFKQLSLQGFLGFVAIIPEFLQSFKSQIRLLYERAIQQGVPDSSITKELLLMVYLHTIPQKFGIQYFFEEDAILVQQSASKFYTNVSKAIAFHVVGQLAKSLVCKWLPVVGNLLSQYWTQQFTNSLLQNASLIFSKKLKFVETPAKEEILSPLPEEHEEADLHKLLAMVAIIKQDKSIHLSEKQFFEELMRNSDLDEDEKSEIQEAIESEEPITIDYSFYEQHPEEVMPVLEDLWAIAQIDKNIHLSEIQLLADFAARFNIPVHQLLAYRSS